MDFSPHLDLPYLLPGQAMKHITHNEALRALDAVVQLSVLDRDLSDPPGAPTEGARYLVAATPTAAWAGQEGRIAAWQEGAWRFFAPETGWLLWVADEARLLSFDGAGWIDPAETALNPAPMVGVNATADATNRLAVKSPASLFDHAGAGHQLKLNKAGPGDTAAVLLQTGYAGRAELGLAGDDHFRLKTSADGVAWHEALSVDNGSGALTLPAGMRHGPTGKPLRDLLFTPGGEGQVTLYRNDRTRIQNPRTAAIASVAGDVLTLSGANADLFFHSGMAGVSMVRVWNQSKAPEQSTWVKAVPDWATGKTQLQVHAAASIAGWTTGEIIRVGDPVPGVIGARGFAIDISPMLTAVLGASFRQGGLMLRTGLAGIGVRVGLAFSGTGASGSFSGVNSLSDGSNCNGMAVIATSALSPVSNSNLLYLREDDSNAGTLGATSVSAIGVFA